MKNTYQILGMTCQNCKNTVLKYLESVPDVKEVTINLEEKEATVFSNKKIEIKEFQNILSEKYNITFKKEKAIFSSGKDELNKPSKLKQLKPLFLILFYITVSCVLLNYKSWNTKEVMLDFMGLFFVVFSFFKMLDLKGFVTSFKMYDPLAKKAHIYGKIYPFLETILGLFFLMRFQVDVAIITTILILGITTIGVTKTLLKKREIQCACLGTALKLPMTQATLIENTIMIFMAFAMLLF
ncbi:MauE/DoxX family redox-associated membrane protein [uncultured Polaribacter sp.]|uniref:heavy-metal-associated domain-containing protein n=1 Tax=uncultured Polaribacter sp. TaxID=174711 RepID=UPI002639E82A|nr:MauE/DoxX family redox-associated membrane protein [uncultured Polaribacter sp.]